MAPVSPEAGPLRRSVTVGLVAAALAAGIVVVLAIGAGGQAPVRVGAFTTSYDQRELHDPLEILIVQSDGQAFASLARDPTLARPEVFRTPAEASYRSSRPLLGWMAWALSAGRPSAVPAALALLAVAGTGLAASGLARLLIERDTTPWPAVLVAVLPGTYSALTYLGPEPLCLGLLAWGIWAWTTPDRRTGLATALFCLAALTRETALLVPLALGAHELWATRRERRPLRELGLLALAAPFVVLLTWFAVLNARVGAWPTDAGEGRLTHPLGGLLEATGQWEAPRDELLLLVLAGLLVVTVLWRCRGDVLAWVVGAHVAFALLLGDRVWRSWQFYGRVLLPLFAFGFVAVLSRLLPAREVSYPSPETADPAGGRLRIHAQASST
jgi:hypothetical protein